MTVGLDPAENVFQVHAIDAEGKVFIRLQPWRWGVEVPRTTWGVIHQRSNQSANSYLLSFAAWFKTWFTSDGESRRERAIAAGFMPAWCDAIIRLAFPAGKPSSASRFTPRAAARCF